MKMGRVAHQKRGFCKRKITELLNKIKNVSPCVLVLNKPVCKWESSKQQAPRKSIHLCITFFKLADWILAELQGPAPLPAGTTCGQFRITHRILPSWKETLSR